MKQIILSIAILLGIIQGSACTSAIVSGSLTKDGRPILWKHRDTGEENNKVARTTAKDGTFEYIALYNASDKNNREAWIGYNTEGFAIMNTASYNIKDDNVKKMDEEGIIMAEALATCSTVNDFERLLITHKKPLRVEANFGVIDALGNGAYFETNNTTYTKFDLKDTPQGIIVRTNYSHSGRKDEGYGYIREQNAIDLLAPYIANKSISPEVFTEYISRSFYNSLIGKDFSKDSVEWIVDQDFIPRRISTATTCIEGVLKNESPLLTTMWIGIGYPPCSEIRMARTGENGIPIELQASTLNGHSSLCDTVVKRKNDVFPIKRGSGKSYLNIKKLYNSHGTGYCQILYPINRETYRKGYEKLDSIRKQLIPTTKK